MEYLVILDGGQWPPKHRHTTFDSAEQEAKRLSEKFQSTSKVVAIVAEIKKKPIYKFQTNISFQGQQIIDAEEDELPF